MKTEDIKKKLKPRPAPPGPTTKDYLSTGSTHLNLAMTGKPHCGFLKGHYYLLVGDSQSGKTWLSLTCLAEASLNPEFKNHRFIFDNKENGALMDIGHFFGRKTLERLEPPSRDGEGNPIYSDTIEEFYYHVHDAILDGRPFIYILDSSDALSSDSEQDKFEEQKKAHRKGKEAPGSYGDGKAKINSSNLRQLLTPLAKTGSILIVINQTRDNVGTFSFEKKTRSGGKAMTFYASMELWSSVVGKIKKTVNGKPRQIGTYCEVRTKKNRLSGKDRSVIIPIYWSHGIDDVGACVDYLVEEGHWKKAEKGELIDATELGLKASREKIIHYVEKNDMEKDVQELVRDVWDEIEDACKVQRKNRYE